MNEILANAKVKLWSACKLGDNELLTSVIKSLLIQVEKSFELEEQNKEDVTISSHSIINKDDITKLVNDSNEDGNTMLHLAALGGHLKLVWYINVSLIFFYFIELLSSYSILGNYWKLDQILAIKIRNCKHHMQRRMIRKLEIFLEDLWALIPINLIIARYLLFIFFLFIKIIFIYYYYKLIHILSIIKSQIPGPLTDEIEHEESEKKRQQRKIKREKDKLKRKEFELKKQEEDAKQRYLCLSDREKVYLLKNNYEIYKYCIDKLNY